MKKLKGKLIVIEGTDGSGKTVQWRMLAEHFRARGDTVSLVDFPQYDKNSSGLLGNYLREVYGGVADVSPYAASLFYAIDRFDLAYNVRGNMRDWLDAGNIVLANRYVASNGGHQGGKIQEVAALKEFLHWLFDTEYRILGIPRPDINVFLDVPLSVSQKLREKRGAAFRDAHEADEQHLIDADRAYRAMIMEFPDDFVVIECTRGGEILDKEIIHERVWGAVSQKLGL